MRMHDYQVNRIEIENKEMKISTDKGVLSLFGICRMVVNDLREGNIIFQFYEAEEDSVIQKLSLVFTQGEQDEQFIEFVRKQMKDGKKLLHLTSSYGMELVALVDNYLLTDI